MVVDYEGCTAPLIADGFLVTKNNMTHKQIIGAVITVLVFVTLAFFSRQLFSRNELTGQAERPSQVMPQNPDPDRSQSTAASVVTVPDTIGEVAGKIEDDALTDSTALDNEEESSLDQVNQGSDSVNNLGTSYDENNL